MYTAGPSGVVTVPLPLKPRFLVASDRSQVARRRVRLDLGDLGIIEQQLNQSFEPACSQPLPSCDAFASDWSIRVLLDRFLLPTIRPRFQEQRTTAYPIGSPFSIAMYGVTDSCAKTLSTVPVRQQVSGVPSPPHHSTI